MYTLAESTLHKRAKMLAINPNASFDATSIMNNEINLQCCIV